MKNFILSDFEKLIDKYSDRIDFGPPIYDIQIKKAEETIGLPFTISYKNCLKNFGISEIGCDEILTVYEESVGAPVDCIPAGDLVYHHLLNIKNGLARPQQLIVYENTFVKYFTLITLNFKMVNVHFISGFQLVLHIIMQAIFMNFSIKELRLILNNFFNMKLKKLLNKKWRKIDWYALFPH